MLLLCRVSLTTCHAARLFASTHRPCGCRRLRFSFRAIKKERRKESLFPPRISRPPSNYGAHSKSHLNCSPIPSLLLLDTARAKRRRKEEGGGDMREGRSLAETPTWSVATVTTAMVAVCFLVERSIYRFGKAMFAALEKIREGNDSLNPFRLPSFASARNGGS
ncbi:hypothetical protein BHE74_00054344 [Ensete ventricosum]|nr:hypothetical protein BHE74_00054344 [Ensete ventricosum]